MEWKRAKEGDTFVMFETYSSFNEYADTAETRAGNDVKRSPDAEWAGCSFAESLRLSRLGWDEQLPKALDIAERAVKRAESEIMDDGFAAEWDVTGAEVDMGRYLQKVPECMLDFPIRQVPTTGTVATLVASRAVSGSVEAETFIKLGTVVSALALALDRLGVNTELYIDYAADQGNYKLYQSVKVKGAADSLDPASILFAYAHPSVLRRLAFATWDNLNGDQAFTKKFGEASRGRGSPGARPRSVKGMYPEGTIFLPSLNTARDVPNADDFLKKYLGQLGLIE